MRRVNISLCCEVLGYSRQAYYKPQAPEEDPIEIRMKIKEITLKERKGCPGKGCRAIYNNNATSIEVGRDKAERMMLEMALGVRKPSKYVRTTEAGMRLFDNLLVEKEVTGLNQVWQSDMTYYQIGSRNYYLIFIVDVYSQNIVGSGAYSRAYSENFCQVLKGAIELRKRQGYRMKGLIFHSDGGKQYEARDFRAICNGHGIIQSMCYYSWENPYAEKTNDIIKNRYLKQWNPMNYKELSQLLINAVQDHNKNQPKKVLGGVSPMDFENGLQHKTSGQENYTLKLKPENPRTKFSKFEFINIRTKSDNQI